MTTTDRISIAARVSEPGLHVNASGATPAQKQPGVVCNALHVSPADEGISRGASALVSLAETTSRPSARELIQALKTLQLPERGTNFELPTGDRTAFIGFFKSFGDSCPDSISVELSNSRDVKPPSFAAQLLTLTLDGGGPSPAVPRYLVSKFLLRKDVSPEDQKILLTRDGSRLAIELDRSERARDYDKGARFQTLEFDLGASNAIERITIKNFDDQAAEGAFARLRNFKRWERSHTVTV